MNTQFEILPFDGQEWAGELGEKWGEAWEQEAGAIEEARSPVISHFPATIRRRFQRIGTVLQALGDSRAANAGLYLIEFNDNGDGKGRGYVGRTRDIHRRLLEHQSCAWRMGVAIDRHIVWVARFRDWNASGLQSAEHKLLNHMLIRHKGKLHNRKREFEQEVHGELCACARCAGL